MEEQKPAAQNPAGDGQHIDAAPSGNNHLRTTILTSAEGHILLTGLALCALYLVWLAISYLIDPETSRVYTTMTLTHVFFGRAAGMSYGYAAKLSHGLVVFVNILVESIEVMLFYPLFVLSWRKLLVIHALRDLMARTREAAEANHSTIKKFGILGLFAFVWFPFWMTGPLVGSVIGFLIGLRPWVNMIVVLGGTAVAIFSWGVLLREIHKRLSEYSSAAPMVVVGILVVIIAGFNIAQLLKKRKVRKAAAAQKSLPPDDSGPPSDQEHREE